MPDVILGNVSVLEPWKPDEGTDETRIRARPDLGAQETSFGLPPINLEDTVNPVTGRRDGWDFGQWVEFVLTQWQVHSDASPAWVESDNDALATVLSETMGCPIGRPDGWRRGADFVTRSPERIETKKREE